MQQALSSLHSVTVVTSNVNDRKVLMTSMVLVMLEEIVQGSDQNLKVGFKEWEFLE